MGNEVSAEAMYQSGRSYRVIPIRKREKKPLPEPDFGKASVVNKPNPLDRKLEKRREEQKQKELEEFVKEALKIHNEYRKRHGVPNLDISKTLCAHAQKWANEIAEKDLTLHSKCVLSNSEVIGENIYTAWSTAGNHVQKARDAVRSWYDESLLYNYNQAKFSFKTGQFTQLVWKDTKSLGIAWASSNEGNVYIVANYSPAGNVRKQFTDNVLPPIVTSSLAEVHQHEPDDVSEDSDSDEV